MGRINKTRAVLGGIVAGLAINLGELVFQREVFRGSHPVHLSILHLHPLVGNSDGWFDIGGAVAGIVGLLVYATLSARWGRGTRMAVIAGLIIWVAASLLPAMLAFAGQVANWSRVWPEIAWTLVEVPLAVMVGALIYKD